MEMFNVTVYRQALKLELLLPNYLTSVYQYGGPDTGAQSFTGSKE